MKKRKSTKKSKVKKPLPPRIMTGLMKVIMPDGIVLYGFGSAEISQDTTFNLRTEKFSSRVRAAINIEVRGFTQEKS